MKTPALKFENFVFSLYYPIVLGLITAFFYAINQLLAGFIIIGITGIFVALCYRNILPFYSVVVFTMMLFKNLSPLDSFPVYIIFGLMVLSLILHFIIYPVKKFRFGSLFLPLVVLSVSLFMGGLFSDTEKNIVSGIVNAFALGPLVLIAYIIITNYYTDIDTISYKEYISYTIVAFALTGGTEVFINMINHKYFGYPLMLSVGWGNINAVGVLILVAMGCLWYLLITNRRFGFNLTCLCLLYVFLFSVDSDGCSGLAVFSLPFVAILAYTRSDLYHKKFLKVLYAILFYIAIIGVCAILSCHSLTSIFNFIKIKLNNDNHRAELYIEAFDLIKRFPIFGAGIGYISPSGLADVNSLNSYNFHSTFIHAFAVCGIFGLAGMVYMYFARFRILTHSNSTFTLFMCLAYTFFALYGSVDACEFAAMPNLLILTGLFVSAEWENKKGCVEPLPLYMKHFKFNLNF